jgi:hypothetical protein
MERHERKKLYSVFEKGGVMKTVQKLGRSYAQWKNDNNFECLRVGIQQQENFCFTSQHKKMHKATTHWTKSRSEPLL